jgi:RNA recognition motif-containing protein
LNTKNHFIKHRTVEINQAIKRNGEVPEDIKSKHLRKLFVGGLSSEITREHIIDYFSQFGTVTNAYVIYDPISKQTKSTLASPDFGYIEFADQQTASEVCLLKSHLICGKKITLQFFKSRDSPVQEYATGSEGGGSQKYGSPAESLPVFCSGVANASPASDFSHWTASFMKGSGPDLKVDKPTPVTTFAPPPVLQQTQAFSLSFGPSKPAAASKPRKFKDFYSSLKRISASTDEDTKAVSRNLRFNQRIAHCPLRCQNPIVARHK